MSNDRTPFRDWINTTKKSVKPLLPLTHITLGRFARDILLDGKISPRFCSVQKENLVYCFYGRAAYRISGEETITMESRVPICLVFDGKLLDRAKGVFPFDTGAFEISMYKDYLGSEFFREDFLISGDAALPNTLIEKIYPSIEAYVDGVGETVVNADEVSARGDFEVQAYLNLINSKGNNGPDDRVGSIEVSFSDPVPTEGNLLCAIVPHTLIDGDTTSDWIRSLADQVDVLPYEFKPRRKPEFYHAQIDSIFTEYCRSNGLL